MRSRKLSRVTAAGTVVIVAVTLTPLVGPATASAAGGPSVGLPAIASTPVTSQAMGPSGPDEASDRALTGNQPDRPATEGGGTSAATPLSPSATWDVSAHTGDFSWSYPLRVPPAPGGLAPNLALSYRSSTVDGRTSVTNNQPSAIGDGWELSPGFVERGYGACADDTEGNKPPQVGDLCWRSDNASAIYSGGGGPLICCDADKKWRAEADDGSRIERVTDQALGNGDNDGEHWKITTVDGTEYWFGSQVDSKSTWTVPVFGDDTNEPCNRPGSFDNSHCPQAWRWLLDKVVDRNGNIIRYYYETESNNYGLNVKDAAAPYIRGGILKRIDYGLRDGISTPSARVEFTPANRCVPGSDCTHEAKNNWPDTDLDNKCVTATCKDRYTPTFWSTQRLSSITTQVWNGAAYSTVDRWDLEQSFPDPGDGEKAALWLKGIKHTGLVGGEKALPDVTFLGMPYDNRVDTAEDGVAPLGRFRITGVVSESGGWTSVSYSSECKPGGPIPNKDRLNENTLRCFPVRWNKKHHAERLDFFHKYVVSTVTQSDRISANKEMTTSYEYLGGAAWHWDTSEFTKEDKKTWNEFRGYGQVRVRSGSTDDPAGGITMAEQRFYRGMNGDKNATGTRKVKDSNNVEYTDEDWLRGFEFESATFDGAGPDPARVGKTIVEPTWQGPTATRGAYNAYIVREGMRHDHTALPGNTWRSTRTETSYDDRGLPHTVSDLGDITTADDDRCSTTTYTRNTGKWLLNLPGHVETVSVKCKQDKVFPRDALADTLTTFDGNGNVTTVKVAKERPAAAPVYVTTSTTDYDVHGRPTAVTDALGHTTRTEYTPKTGGPLTTTVITTPPTAAVDTGLITTTALHPAWGTPTKITDPNGRITDIAYDALGRKVQVWLPNRSQVDYPTKPSVAYDYQINKDAPTAVTTTKVGPRGSTITSNVIYDGLMRVRQAQSPALGGGRLLTDTRYDSHGRVWKSTQPYFNNAGVDTKLLVAADVDIPGHTRTHYDDAGRPDASIYFAGAHEKWRTSTSYGGDRVTVTPPAGGTATTTITDARGQTTQLRQYTTPGPSDSFETTNYTHTKAGQLESVTTPDGATWRYGYDLLGHQIRAEDPDTGTSISTYTDLGQLATRRDAAGTTLAYDYDVLGRTTRTRVGATVLTEQTYDTATNGKGQSATSTRWVERDGAKHAYTTSVLAYDPLYQPTGGSLTIPPVEGLLAGTYRTYAGYNPDGSLAGESYSAAGELPEEEVSYDYDDLGPIKTSNGGYDGETFEHVTNTQYTRYGELARLQFGKDKRVWLSNYYDTNTRRLNRSIVDAEVSNPMQTDRHYTYSPAGLITSLADTFADDIQCFRYDQLSRLTDAWTPAESTWSETEGCKRDPDTAALAGPARYRHSYTYDKAGNRSLEVQHATERNTIRTYTYGLPGHIHALGSVTTDGPGLRTREDYTYEPTGETHTRTTASGTQEFDWDAEGQLASVTENGKTTSLLYNASGARLIRRDPDATTLYLGKQELRVNHAGGNPSVTRYYTHGGQTIAMRQGKGALTWLAGDHQATTQVAINSGTQTVTQRRQLPFGAPRGPQVTFPGERGFVGGTTDASTGLTHLGAREYDPTTGRFSSVDPIMNPASPHQLNGYTYSNNNPISFSDPSGLYCDSCDFYGRRDGTGSVWTPPPPNKPVVSRTDQQVWRQEKGSRATTVKKPPPPKPASAPNNKGYCRMSTGAFTGGIEVCGYGEPMSPANHAMLEACGEIPVWGIPCNGINAMAYAEDGDWVNAAGSALAIIGGRGGKAPTKACSFTGDTEVVMADGSTKPISKIELGDQVLAADPKTGEKGPRTVRALWVHKDTVQKLTLGGGGTVTTTENHPFWSDTDKQWKRADQLDSGDALLTTTGEHTTRVVGLLPATRYVDLAYNLTVDDLHTYHVVAGNKSVLVHNRCDEPPTLYRYDSRGPDDIFENGFDSWGDNMDLQHHTVELESMPGGSGFISTTTDLDYAREVQLDAGDMFYVYEIRGVRGIDVNKALGDDSEYPFEKEIAVERRIPADCVAACYPPNGGRKKLNPNYRGR